MAVPNSATVIVAALILTGLASSMALREHVTEMHVSDGAYARVYPAGVFRASHPTVLATGRLFES